MFHTLAQLGCFKSQVCRFSIGLVFVLTALLGRSDAGCHYGPNAPSMLSEAEGDRLVLTVERSLQKRRDVTVVYEQGQFSFFASKGAIPCNGPTCEQRKSETSLAPADNSERQPSTQAVRCKNRLVAPERSVRSESAQDQHELVVSMGGVFRPPRG